MSIYKSYWTSNTDVLADLSYAVGTWSSVQQKGSAPSHERLDFMAANIGRQSQQQGKVKSWTCPFCGTKYAHVKNRLASLPLTNCMKCGIENDVDFNFILPDHRLNGIDISIPVMNQESTPYCTLYSTIASSILSRKVSGAADSRFLPGTLSLCDMLQKYEKLTESKFGFEDYRDLTRVYNLHSILKTDGVAYKSESIFQSIINPDKRVFKIEDFWEVDKSDFGYIARLLASGFPLVTGMVPGKHFQGGSAYDAYNPPSKRRLREAGKSNVGHAVVLIGAGRQRGVKYFWLLNSWGEEFGDKGRMRIVVGGILSNPIGMTVESYL